ncbi:hypothetical protein [Microbulbifer sp. VAAF005]|uniref:hypothetical protein n=1 Tax=unclassified Microbulbifer TaxID=2619833 RepID=UPI0024ACDC9D|nr:hypothetical protein [Microbulbifer sp. VAAF005]WHI46114.1 hypothetical protein P0078_20710 [Microbulbifer sp. VAAF005]
MIIIGEKRDKEIKNLEFPDAIHNLMNGEFVHEDLEYRFTPLKYSLENEDFSPQGIDVIPIWESDYSITGFYLENGSPVFITYDIDDLNSINRIGASVLELVEYLVKEYGEDEEQLKSVLLK